LGIKKIDFFCWWIESNWVDVDDDFLENYDNFWQISFTFTKTEGVIRMWRPRFRGLSELCCCMALFIDFLMSVLWHKMSSTKYFINIICEWSQNSSRQKLSNYYQKLPPISISYSYSTPKPLNTCFHWLNGRSNLSQKRWQYGLWFSQFFFGTQDSNCKEYIASQSSGWWNI